MTWEGLTPPYSTIVVDPPWPYEGGPLGWTREKQATRTAFLPYSAMELGGIRALPVDDLAAPAAHLYLWTTQRYLWDARDIAQAWGWRVLAVLAWCKAPMGLGGGTAFTPTTEFILYGRRPVGALIRVARQQAGLSNGQLEDRIRGKRTALSTRWEEDGCYPTPEDWTQLREALPALAGQPDLAPNPAAKVDSTWWQWPRGSHSQKPAAFGDLVERVSPGPYVELFARQPRLGWDSWGHGYEIPATPEGA